MFNKLKELIFSLLVDIQMDRWKNEKNKMVF